MQEVCSFTIPTAAWPDQSDGLTLTSLKVRFAMYPRSHGLSNITVGKITKSFAPLEVKIRDLVGKL